MTGDLAGDLTGDLAGDLPLDTERYLTGDLDADLRGEALAFLSGERGASRSRSALGERALGDAECSRASAASPLSFTGGPGNS